MGGEGSWYLSVFHLVSGKRANRNSNLYLVSTLENENIFVLFFSRLRARLRVTKLRNTLRFRKRAGLIYKTLKTRILRLRVI